MVGAQQSSSSDRYFCTPCRLMQACQPTYDQVSRLVNAWKQLQVCLPDGRTLAWLTERATAWQSKLNHVLRAANLTYEAVKLTGKLLGNSLIQFLLCMLA